jgi:hypothetical protein
MHPFRDIHRTDEFYQACKDIDNYKGEGTFSLAGRRVGAFWDIHNR